MSGFKALNVESDSEDEIDDTKEIQLEEAFKLYQNALKLHSQGPAYYNEAGEAYEELFKSEVFKYPEVVSEFAHDQLDDEPAPVTSAVEPEADAVPIVPTNAADSAANSIPQLVYLSYKNKGQFSVDDAQSKLPLGRPSRNEILQHYSKPCKTSLADFAEALERDDTDIDLWKKAARVAEVLATQRITRFCLESVLAGDDDGSEQTIDLSGLDEAFAAGELEQVLKLLQDDLSKSHASNVRPKKLLLDLLSKSNDPFPILPKRSNNIEYIDPNSRPNAFQASRITLNSDSLSGFGRDLLQIVQKHQEGAASVSAQSLVTVIDSDIHESPHEADKDVFVDAEEQMEVIESKPTLAQNHSENVSAGDEDLNKVPSAQSAGRASVSHDLSTDIDAEKPAPETATSVAANEPRISTDLPTRKRSSTTAGNEEEGRARSKRIRARESMVAEAVVQEEEAGPEVSHFQSWHWTVLQNADQDMFRVVNAFLQRLGIPQVDTIEGMRTDWTASSDSGHESSRQLLCADFGNGIRSWDDEHSQAILHGHGSQEFVEKSAGLTLFMQHSKATNEIEPPEAGINEDDIVASFVSDVNSTSTTLYDAVFSWFLALLTSKTDTDTPSLYMSHAWSEDLKQTVVQLLLKSEESLQSILRQHLRALSNLTSSLQSDEHDDKNIDWASRLTEMVQTIFELQLDIHSRINNPSSQVEAHTRKEQLDSLERWATLADDFMRFYGNLDVKGSDSDDLVVRFLWSSTLYAGKAEDVDQHHIISCLEDLKRILTKLHVSPVLLANNAAMPQISVEAAEQEIFRLSTLDFFMSVFDTDNSDPVAVIEKLEPILEYDRAKQQSDTVNGSRQRSSEADELLRFLDSGDASLKLFLWRRLQNAYIAVSYIPKVVSCQLRSFEIIYEELCSSRHAQLDDTARQLSMLQWLKDADELLIRILSKGLGEPNALECIDQSHLQSSLTAVSAMLRLLHSFALYEDDIRFGKDTPPQFKSAASAKLFDKSRDRLREMQVRLWSVQYHLFKEGASQNRDEFSDMANDLADYLCTTHHALGQRHYCKYSNKQFVRLVKNELNTLDTTNDYSADRAQVCYDLYQLKFAVSQGDYDHGCPPENLDKKTAISIIPLAMFYAKRLPIKDLIKSELKNTIDKVQAASGTIKSPPAALYNKRMINAWLKRPVLAEEMYRAVKGLGDLPTRSVPGEPSIKASSGWYFLLGHMTLAKYRSVKRVSPTPTDDLDVAATYLRQDLEYDIERWETWFRLAQIYEAKIEDDLIWNSTKLNDARNDIAQLERTSIHAFTMAVAVAMRTADDSIETAQKLAELYQEFAMRLYASSRAPLDMEAFRTDKDLRHMSHFSTMAMSKEPWHEPLSMYAVWSFAAHLLRRKFTNKPKPWLNHYTLGKCLWKMFQSADNANARHPVRPEQVLEVFVEAVELVPPKERSSEPILEPHFKLVSTVHKMVHRKVITPQQGQEWLQHTKFAHNAHLAEDEDGPDWEKYILDILKKLSNADKQNWHHRIIARSAHVIYDDAPNVAGALGAKHEFTQQIFTKTMTYQVWKPEYERPGRHYVYTGRYVLFFAHLLDQLKDRANLDQLVRRVRRKQTDFIDHTQIWESVTSTYVRLLRQIGEIPEGKERAVFDPISFEEFTRNSEKLETWAHDEDTTSVVLDVMRDAIDLKKLNNSLAKGGVIDELIGDAYATMYETFISQLPPEEKAAPAPPPLLQGTFINITSEQVQQPTGNVPSQQDPTAQTPGVSTEPGQISTPAPVGLGVQTSTPTHQFIASSVQSPQPEPFRPPEKAKPGRAKTITRREIQRKAESALVKPPPIKTPVLSKRPVVEIPSADVESPAPARDFDQAMTDARFDRLREEDGQDSRMTSRRGSLDAGDDADVESDLSEIDEGNEGSTSAQIVKSMFPNLMKGQDGEGQQSDADDDLEEDEDQEDDTADIDEHGEIGEGGENEEDEDEGEDEEVRDDDRVDGMDVDTIEVEIPESPKA